MSDKDLDGLTRIREVGMSKKTVTRDAWLEALGSIEVRQVEEHTDAVTVRELAATWDVSMSTARERVSKMMKAGLVKRAYRRNPRSGTVPIYYLTKEAK